MPPETRRQAANRIGQGIPGIPHRPGHNMRANHFEQNRPDTEIEGYLPRSGRPVVVTQLEPPLQRQEHRQRARDQQHIVKMIVQKRRMNVRFHQPSIGGVQSAAHKEQGVSQVTEGSQSKARMTKPNPTASANLNKRIITQRKHHTIIWTDTRKINSNFELSLPSIRPMQYSAANPFLSGKRPRDASRGPYIL